MMLKENKTIGDQEQRESLIPKADPLCCDVYSMKAGRRGVMTTIVTTSPLTVRKGHADYQDRLTVTDSVNSCDL